MTKEERDRVAKEIESAWNEGFDDATFKLNEYMKECCWRQSMAKAYRFEDNPEEKQ